MVGSGAAAREELHVRSVERREEVHAEIFVADRAAADVEPQRVAVGLGDDDVHVAAGLGGSGGEDGADLVGRRCAETRDVDRERGADDAADTERARQAGEVRDTERAACVVGHLNIEERERG